jgi:polar amino acid transport system permease protein
MDDIRHWFRVYKVPEGKGENDFAFGGKWLDRATTLQIIDATHAQWKALVQAGFDRIQISGLVAGIGVLGIVQGAYATEVLRGAILAVPPGQIEAARAMGMPPLKLARRITLPAMLAFALPGLANLWLIATKDTALLAVVGFGELTLETKQAAGATKHYFTFFLAAGLLYLLITLLSGRVFARIERWARRGEPRISGGGR